MVERHFDVVDVRGSTPLSPTRNTPARVCFVVGEESGAFARGVEDFGDVLSLKPSRCTVPVGEDSLSSTTAKKLFVTDSSIVYKRRGKYPPVPSRRHRPRCYSGGRDRRCNRRRPRCLLFAFLPIEEVAAEMYVVSVLVSRPLPLGFHLFIGLGLAS